MRSIAIAIVLILMQSPVLAAAVPRCERTENPFYGTLSLGPSADLGTDTLSHDGFVIRLVVHDDGLDHFEQVRVEREGRLLLQWPERGHFGDRAYTTFGIVSFLDSDEPVLMISSSSGGAYCCTYRRLHLLDPDLPLIFDSSKYVDSSWREVVAACDLDGDGNGEIILNASPFGGRANVPGAFRRWLPVVFRYDPSRRIYIPANQEFPDVAKYGEAGLLERLGTLERQGNPTRFLPDLIELVLIHLYAEEEAAAWDLFETYYTLADAPEVREAIENALESDPFYQAVREIASPARVPDAHAR